MYINICISGDRLPKGFLLWGESCYYLSLLLDGNRIMLIKSVFDMPRSAEKGLTSKDTNKTIFYICN